MRNLSCLLATLPPAPAEPTSLICLLSIAITVTHIVFSVNVLMRVHTLLAVNVGVSASLYYKT